MQDSTPETREMGCPCGAPRKTGRKRCAKCLARARWYRRKAWRTSSDHAIKAREKEVTYS
jgi:hypothetical protein